MTKILNAILQMAYLKLYIPLSMLTTSALLKIWSKDGLKYHKIPFGNGAGRQSLNESIFLPDVGYSYTGCWEVVVNWLACIKLLLLSRYIRRTFDTVGPLFTEVQVAYCKAMYSDTNET